MSSRGGHRRRDRSWERDDRDRDRDRGRERYESNRRGRNRDEKRRPSRSRSPRRGDKDRRDRRDRDYDYRRDDERRDRDGGRDRRDDRRRDRDDRRETTRRDDKTTSGGDEKHSRDVEMKDRPGSSANPATQPEPPKGNSASSARPSVDPKTPEHIHEDGEAMDDLNDDDAAMMAAMGLGRFGSTKGKHVEGNQEGTSNVKKVRTWRQYMNRRGGFNRPLDKIK